MHTVVAHSASGGMVPLPPSARDRVVKRTSARAERRRKSTSSGPPSSPEPVRKASRPGPRTSGKAAPEPRSLAWIGWIALPLALLLTIALAWRQETSIDLGFHVASGRWILEHAAWPKTDSFTYTLGGRPYIDMHGLFQVVVALLYDAGGLMAVGILRVLMLVATVALMWPRLRVRDGTSSIAALFVMVPSLLAWEIRFMIRPELVTYLCLAAMLLLLERHRDTGRALWAWLCVPVQAVWVYGHALSMFGILVLGAWALTTTITRRREPETVRLTWLVLLAAAVVLMANPYGIQGVKFLWNLRTRLQEGNPFGESIGELASPFSSLAAGFLPILVMRGLLAASALLVLARIRRFSAFELILIVVLGWLAATHIRNVGLFVVAAAPWLGRELGSLWPRKVPARRVTPWLGGAGAVAVGLLIATIIGGSYYARDQRPMRFGYRASDASYPTGVIERFATGEVRGPIFNALDFGGYLLLHLWPRERVFIDGRLEVAGEAFFREYQRIMSGPGWAKMVARHRPQAVVIPYAYSGLAQHLAADSTWRLVDADGVSVLFVATDGPNAGVAARHVGTVLAVKDSAAADTSALLPWRTSNVLTRTFGPRRFPFLAWGRANAMVVLGRDEAARRDYARALREADADEPVLVRNYALICEQMGRRAEALAWYRRLLALAPRDAVGREGLARLAGSGP